MEDVEYVEYIEDEWDKGRVVPVHYTVPPATPASADPSENDLKGYLREEDPVMFEPTEARPEDWHRFDYVSEEREARYDIIKGYAPEAEPETEAGTEAETEV